MYVSWQTFAGKRRRDKHRVRTVNTNSLLVGLLEQLENASGNVSRFQAQRAHAGRSLAAIALYSVVVVVVRAD